MVSKNNFKLSRLTLFSAVQKGCPKKHRDASDECEVSVVYEILMAWGFSYLRQTGRCINDGILEHKREVLTNASKSEIAIHLGECDDCSQEWTETKIVSKKEGSLLKVVEGDCSDNKCWKLHKCAVHCVRHGVADVLILPELSVTSNVFRW